MNSNCCTLRLRNVRVLIGLLAIALGSNVALANEESPTELSHDGLEVVKEERDTEVQLHPGVDWSQYTQYIMLEPQVSFKENWKRDYNREQRSLSDKVDDKDMLRIKNEVAENFSEIFTEVIDKESGLKVVAEPAVGVLLIKPVIINLDVTAPDLMSASRSKTYVRSAGSATLYLEVYDGVSGAILGRWIDRRDAPDYGYAQWATRSSNRREARRIIRTWADRMVDAFNELKAGK